MPFFVAISRRNRLVYEASGGSGVNAASHVSVAATSSNDERSGCGTLIDFNES